MPILLALSFAVSATALPPAPQSGGHMACVVYDKTRDKVILTRPFASGGADQSSKYAAFLAGLRAEGYLPADSQIEGACTESGPAQRVAEVVTAFRNRYPGANQLTVPFE